MILIEGNTATAGTKLLIASVESCCDTTGVFFAKKGAKKYSKTAKAKPEMTISQKPVRNSF
ncbi:hypothetical protein LPO01_04270 [Ligilactobacillus pobuzihii]|nr:hypothetical protein LPO01_04270 [Ligilactobacillus pobuzihii]